MTNSVDAQTKIEINSTNPYRGPRPFTQANDPLFCGREQEARELLSLVISEPLVLFHAQSGAGKSSLLNARLIPGLKEEGFYVLPVGRVGNILPNGLSAAENTFIASLLFSLNQDEFNLEQLSQFDLSNYLQATTRHVAPVQPDVEPVRVLVIDQFEEILTTHLDRWPEREGFFKQIRQAMDDDPLLWVILVAKEAHVAALEPYARLLSGRLRARFHMLPLTFEAALEAVSQPAAAGGRPFAPEAAEKLVDRLREVQVRAWQPQPQSNAPASYLGEFVDPIQLQVVCYQLWEDLQAKADSEIRVEDVETIEEIDAALAQFYEQAIATTIAETGESEIRLRNWIERQLITELGTSRAVRRGRKRSADLANTVIDHLVEQRLVTRRTRGEDTWYELAHEQLITPITHDNQAWRLLQSALMQDAQAWESEGRMPDRLYQGQQLQEALARVNWHNTDQPTQVHPEVLDPLIREFLAASQEFHRQQDPAWMQARSDELRQYAQDQARNARMLDELAAGLQGVRLAFASLSLLETQYELALLLAIEASRASPSVEAESALRSALLHQGRTLKIYTGHTGGIRRIAWNGADTKIATAGQDHTARIWGMEKGTTSLVLRGHTAPVTDIDWDLMGRRVVTGSHDGTARVWDAQNGAELLTLTGHQAAISQLRCNTYGNRLVTASEDYTARVWDIVHGKALAVLEGHQGPVTFAAWSPSGTRIATASNDHTVSIWDASNGKQLEVLNAHQNAVSYVAWNGSGTRLASAGDDGTARIWNAETGAEVAVLSENGVPIKYTAWNPTGRYLVTASIDGSARVWDVTQGIVLTTLKGHTDEVWQADWDPAGTRLITVSMDGTGRVWDAENGVPLAILSGHFGSVNHASWDSTGTRVATVSDDGTARTWSTQRGYEVAVLEGHTGQVNYVSWDNTDTRLVTTSFDGTARIWEPGRGTALLTLGGHADRINHAAWSVDGGRLATSSRDGTVRIWDTDSGETRFILQGHQPDMWGILHSVWDTSGRRLVTSSGDHTARIWDTDSGETVFVLEGHQGRIWQAAWNIESSSVVTASLDNTARIWDAETGQEQIILAGHTDWVWQAAWDGTSSRLVTASFDGTARVWAAQDGIEQLVLQGHTDQVWLAAWNPANTRIVTAGSDGTARIWDAETGKLLTSLSGHSDGIAHAAWNPAGTRIVTASFDGTARVWDVENGTELTVLAGHQGSLAYVAWNSAGTRIVTASRDGTARLYYVFRDDLIEAACRQTPRNMTPSEWKRYMGDKPYRETCPDVLVPDWD